MRARTWTRRARPTAIVVTCAALAVGAIGVGAGLARTQATILGAPSALTIVTEGIPRSTGSLTPVTLRDTTVTVPAGERHLVVVRVTGSAVCGHPNASLDDTFVSRCQLRVRVGGANAVPSLFEFTRRSVLHAAAARGPLSAGTYGIRVQWWVLNDGSRFELPNGNLVEVEQIRVD